MIRILTGLCLVASVFGVLATCTLDPEAADTPPANPTHHARLEGVVLGSSGEPLDSIRLAVGNARDPVTSTVMSVTGGHGAVTDAEGRYTFIAETIGEREPGPISVALYVYARRYGTAPGELFMHDSTRVVAEFAPIAEAAPLKQVPEIRLDVQ